MFNITLNDDEKFIPYNELVKRRTLEYYHVNKERINQKRKERYANLPSEDKKKLQEYNKQWYNNLLPEKKLEVRIKARKYHKNRYDNLMVRVK